MHTHGRKAVMLFGGDYNPDQWPRAVWDEDMRLFKCARINVATLPVFSWALLQPSEERFEFGWLDDALDLLHRNDIRVCLATGTAAPPAWMVKKYPDVLRAEYDGIRRKFGVRQYICPNSVNFKRLAGIFVEQMAERYKNHPALALWHVFNEYGGFCHCEQCGREFREWLKRKYGTLEEVNRRWYTSFWGHTYYNWEEIAPPVHHTEFDYGSSKTRFPALSLDYSRFNSESILSCFELEKNIIKKRTPNIPVTTNFPGVHKALNYFEWARKLDVIAWDNYPRPAEDPAAIALRHAIMRGLKQGQPFLLMEQSPNQVSGTDCSVLKRPGEVRLLSFQALAHGADAIMFFQLRRSLGGCEKFHGAVIDHCGHERTRVFGETARLGEELERIGGEIIGARIKAEAAIVFDWENWWAMENSSGPSDSLAYLAQVQKYYKAFWDNHLPADIIHHSFDLSQYKMAVLPVSYLMHNGYAKKLADFVKNGGILLATFWSGIVDENDNVTPGGYPAGLKEVLGLWSEEIDALAPGQSNRMVMKKKLGALAGSYQCGLLCDLVHSEHAQVFAVYGKDFYKGMPALTCNSFGRGTAWYIAADPEQIFLNGLVEHICTTAGITPLARARAGIEVTERTRGNDSYLFVLNHGAQKKSISLRGVSGKDLLSGKKVRGKVELEGYEVSIIKRG